MKFSKINNQFLSDTPNRSRIAFDISHLPNHEGEFLFAVLPPRPTGLEVL